ncbi:MAG TPA: hypothetical protein VMW28_09150 [Pelolinea sp.]|nr:hypothetical protein [Pelolinea sp.]
MKKNWLFWVPRILGILFCLFISLFALDAFAGNAPILEKVLGFIIHLMPTAILVASLISAWRWPLPGGFIYLLLGASYFIWARGMHWSAYLAVAGPPILIGLLFLAEGFFSKRRIR